jgi:hypothetical protein
MTSDELAHFREAQKRLQAGRDRSRLWAGAVDVEKLARDCAQRFRDGLTYRRGQWEFDGIPTSPVAVRGAVQRALPSEIQGARRHELASLVIASATFREGLR